MRVEDEVRQTVEPLLDIIENTVRGQVMLAREKLNALSFRPVRSSLWGMPFGDNKYGVYGCTPPELLHQYDLGIIKHAYNCMLALIKEECAGSDAAYSKRMREVDRRL